MHVTLCGKLRKTASTLTTNRARVTCQKCLAEMDRADAFMRWLGTGSREDFETAHAPRGRRYEFQH